MQHIILTLAIDVRGGVNTVELNSANDLDDSHKDEETLDKIVKPVIRDDLFWFDRPTLLLKLIHVILFQVFDSVLDAIRCAMKISQY